MILPEAYSRRISWPAMHLGIFSVTNAGIETGCN